MLRAIAGGVAAPVALSRWFLLVVTCMAVFVAAGKRSRRAAARPVARRRGAPPRARALHRGAACGVGPGSRAARAALFAYCVWAFELPAVDGVPWRPLTVLPFALCLARYGTLLRAGGGEAPEELLLGDRVLQLAGLRGWCCSRSASMPPAELSLPTPLHAAPAHARPGRRLGRRARRAGEHRCVPTGTESCQRCSRGPASRRARGDRAGDGAQLRRRGAAAGGLRAR